MVLAELCEGVAKRPALVQSAVQRGNLFFGLVYALQRLTHGLGAGGSRLVLLRLG